MGVVANESDEKNARSSKALRRVAHTLTIATKNGGKETWRLVAFVDRAWIDKQDPGRCHFVEDDPLLRHLNPIPQLIILSDVAGPRKTRTSSRTSLALTPSKLDNSRATPTRSRSRSKPTDSETPSPQNKSRRPSIAPQTPNKARRGRSRSVSRAEARDPWEVDARFFNYLGESIPYVMFQSRSPARINRPPEALKTRYYLKDGDVYIHQMRTIDPETGERSIPELSLWVWVDRVKKWTWTPVDAGFIHPSDGLEAIRLTLDSNLLPKWTIKGNSKLNAKYDMELQAKATEARKRKADEAALDEEVGILSTRMIARCSGNLRVASVAPSQSRRSRSQGLEPYGEVVPATPPPPDRRRTLTERVVQSIMLNPPIRVESQPPNDVGQPPSKRRRRSSSPSRESSVSSQAHHRSVPKRRSQSVGGAGDKRRSTPPPLPRPPPLPSAGEPRASWAKCIFRWFF
ncbi:hypothetical protein FRB96_007293 [Tulasnella sp. 330]|nr:hypothetical protein FRB96_007293 [Tulasnella sp. 330]